MPTENNYPLPDVVGMTLEEWIKSLPPGTALTVKKWTAEHSDEPAVILDCPSVSQFYVVGF